MLMSTLFYVVTIELKNNIFPALTMIYHNYIYLAGKLHFKSELKKRVY